MRYWFLLAVIGILFASGILYFSGDRESSRDREKKTNIELETRSREHSIEGFYDFPWGATRDEVRARLDAPHDTSTVQNEPRSVELETLLYRDRKYLKNNGDLLFAFDRNSGLAKGVYKVPIRNPKKCLEPVQTLTEEIDERHGSIKQTDQKHNRLDVPFCNALQVGRAWIVRHWKEPDAQIVLSLGWFRKDMITVFVESSLGGGFWVNVSNGSNPKKRR